MSDSNGGKKQAFWNLTGIAALITSLGSFASNCANDKQQGLMLQSVHTIIHEQIPAMRERLAVLEEKSVQPMMIDDMPPEHECMEDGDCSINHFCEDSKCIEELPEEGPPPVTMPIKAMSPTKTAKKVDFKIPEWNEIEQHVQETGTPWGDLK